MKTNKKNIVNQRQIIERKLKPWVNLRDAEIPPSGWIKAIRGALGLNTRQLAEHLGVEHSAILRLEQRESRGKATLGLINKVAHAMSCKLIYAIVPVHPYKDLEAIVENRAKALARELINRVDHSMQLESQGSGQAESQKPIERLAYDLKSKMDSRIWNKRPLFGGKRKS